MDGRGTGPTLPPIGHPKSPGTPGRSSRRASPAVKGPGLSSPGHPLRPPAPELPPISSAVRSAPRGNDDAPPSAGGEMRGGEAALAVPGSRGVHSATGSVQQMLTQVAWTARKPIEQKFNRCDAAPRYGPPERSYLTDSVRACLCWLAGMGSPSRFSLKILRLGTWKALHGEGASGQGREGWGAGCKEGKGGFSCRSPCRAIRDAAILNELARACAGPPPWKEYRRMCRAALSGRSKWTLSRSLAICTTIAENFCRRRVRKPFRK